MKNVCVNIRFFSPYFQVACIIFFFFLATIYFYGSLFGRCLLQSEFVLKTQQSVLVFVKVTKHEEA